MQNSRMLYASCSQVACEVWRVRIVGIVLFSSLLFSCWREQEIVVAPPAHPTYTLYGTVIRQETGLPIRQAMVRASMTEVYQGEFLDPIETYTDSLGYYEIPGLYRAQYAIRVTHGYDWLFDGEIGIIQYEDKEYNILITPPEE